jgi:hypothetical protein
MINEICGGSPGFGRREGLSGGERGHEKVLK